METIKVIYHTGEERIQPLIKTVKQLRKMYELGKIFCELNRAECYLKDSFITVNQNGGWFTLKESSIVDGIYKV